MKLERIARNFTWFLFGKLGKFAIDESCEKDIHWKKYETEWYTIDFCFLIENSSSYFVYIRSRETDTIFESRFNI